MIAFDRIKKHRCDCWRNQNGTLLRAANAALKVYGILSDPGEEINCENIFRRKI